MLIMKYLSFPIRCGNIEILNLIKRKVKLTDTNIYSRSHTPTSYRVRQKCIFIKYKKWKPTVPTALIMHEKKIWS